MIKRVIQTVVILILSFVVVLSISLIIQMLQDELAQNDKLKYERKRNYPLGVNRAQYDKIWDEDEEFEEDYERDYNE